MGSLGLLERKWRWALGHENTKDALIQHTDEDDRQTISKVANPDIRIPNRGMTIINESGL